MARAWTLGAHPELIDLLARRHVEPMVMAGKEAEGWLRVAAEGCLEVDDLRQWVDVGLERVRQLPPKPAKR